MAYVNGNGQVRVGVRGWVPVFTPEGPGTPNTIDQDSTNFILASGISDSVQTSAIETLVSDLKTYGLWTKMKAIYPFVGGTASSHKWNLKDPRDLDAAYRLTFMGGGSHTSYGYVGNSTNGYANTFIVPSTNLSTTSTHISYYSQTDTVGVNKIEIGSSATNKVPVTLYVKYSSTTGIGYLYQPNAGSFTVSTGRRYTIISRTTNSSVLVMNNNSSTTLSQTVSGMAPTNSPLYINASSNNNAPSSGSYSDKTSSFVTIGDGLTSTECSNLYTVVQKFQTTLGRQVGTPYVSDPDAIAFLMAAGITDGTQASAINTLVIRMKADGVWTKMKAIYPFVGGSAASHKWNLKDPRDLDAAYRLVFNGGWVHSSTGALPNGTTGYAETYFIPSTSLTLYSSHLSYYSRTNSTRPTWTTEFSVEKEFSTGVISSMTLYAGSNTWSGAWITSTDSARAYEYVGRSSDFFIGSRTSVNNIKIYRNGLITGSSSIAANLNGYLGAQYPTYSPTIGARKKISTTNSVSYDGFSNRECSFASIGDGLTDGDASNLYSAVQAYQTTLGRQVNVPLVSDTDAQAFLDAANITSFQQASAVNKLVIDLKATGIWSKMKAIYPFVGGSAASHKFNLKDPRDLDAAYRLVFNGGWAHTSTGAQPNGTTGYADTKLKPNNMAQNSAHMSTYLRTYNENGIDMGSNTINRFWISANLGTGLRPLGLLNVVPFEVTGPNLDTRAFLLTSRTDSTTNKLFRNSSLIYNETATSSAPDVYNIYLGAVNVNNGGTSYSSREQAFASIGDGLTDVEATALYTAVQTYQTSLGRGVNTPIYNNGLVLNLDAGNANSYPGTGTTWFDLAAGNNGTLVNGPTYDVNNGGSLYFDGTNDYGNFGNIQSLNSLTSGVTVGAWIKSSSTTTYSAILQKWYQAGVQGGFQLYISPGGILSLAIGDYISSYGGCNSTVSVITGSWVYVTATYDMNSMKIYINGVLNSTNSFVRSVVNSNNATLYVGQDDFGGRFFRGNISSATVHNRSLSATEILNNFNSTRGRFGL